MKNYLITWFYSEQANDESFYPSVGGSSSSAEFQYVYWRCIYVFYRSAIVTNRDIISEYLFFTNVENLPTVDGVNFALFFRENHIKVINLELTRKTPKDWYGAWRNQFYLFDVIEYLKPMEGNFLILDSDCVVMKSLDGLYRDIEQYGILTLPIRYSENREINGCSISQMRELYHTYFKAEYPKKLGYMGGEFIAINSRYFVPLMETFEKIWKENFIRYERGEKKLNEEAHVLSLCYYYLNCQNELGSKYIRRIWTALNFDNVIETDWQLPILHLPAEKKYGFHELFDDLLYHDNIGQIQLLKLVNKRMWIRKCKFLRKINWYFRYAKQKLKVLHGAQKNG
ncbi:MAG: hypothetical protein PUB52_10340 [Lachnospiraceae bacterium]|nr:hypothetical protein [Lachnospiraceae bacterium]